MAEVAKKKRRVVKKSETVREQADKAIAKAGQPSKRRHIRRTASGPFRALFRLIATIFRPFRFVLIPFKTRPVRFIGRLLASILLLKALRNAWRELRQVEWPGAKETTKLTTAVFIFAIIFGIIIALTDYGLDKVFRKVLIK